MYSNEALQWSDVLKSASPMIWLPAHLRPRPLRQQPDNPISGNRIYRQNRAIPDVKLKAHYLIALSQVVRK